MKVFKVNLVILLLDIYSKKIVKSEHKYASMTLSASALLMIMVHL
jgi:hypothetical protein